MQTQSKKLDFTGQNFFCGIDMHKKSWAVTIETEDVSMRTFVQNADPDSLIHHLKNNFPGANITAGYEAGYFGFWAQRKLEAAGIECLVLNPADIPTTHKEKDQKRDPSDSRKIARAIRNQDATTIWIPPVSIQEDRQLLRTRRMLAKDLSRNKNRIKAILQLNGIQYPAVFARDGSHWSRRFIIWLESIRLTEETGTESLQTLLRNLLFLRSELLVISRRIRKLAQSDRYKPAYDRLVDIPGIGFVVAMTILTEIGDISRFRNTDQFRSYLGLVPTAHDSGEKEHPGRITNRANKPLRALLVEATWSAIRTDAAYLSFYRTYKKRMKENHALIRTAKKLANQIYYAIKMEKN
jgi:transposase